MRGTIRPRRLKAKGQLFVVGDLQAASCQRRARGVADEAFQTGSVADGQQAVTLQQANDALGRRLDDLLNVLVP